ncbi:MAG: hypothetical protein NZM12_11860, partial [Steroidobacteraceae bacterium]|nr:hypothetical protein [Steroidobacteraceae bacterium]
LNSNSVINVDSVAAYTAAYPGGSIATSFVAGTNAHLRAVISDPFGSFDIASARLTLLDPNNTVVLNNVPMPLVADSGAATRTYEAVFAIPTAAPLGPWTVRVVGTEGTEGTVTDLGVGSFVVAPLQPQLRVQKTSEVLSDPANSGSNPKRIPGALVRYAVTVTNGGPGTIDASTLVITDRVPANTALYVATSGGDPIEFLDGTTPSGLSYSYAAHVSYSAQPGGGPPYNYLPTPDADGFDAAVTGLRIAPAGQMNAASGAAQPAFTVRYRVRVR